MLLHNILYCLVEVGFQIESKFHFELALEKLEKEKKILSSFLAFGLLGLLLPWPISRQHRPASLPTRSGPLSLVPVHRPFSPLLPAWAGA